MENPFPPTIMGHDTWPTTYTPAQCKTVADTIRHLVNGGKLTEEQNETALAILRKLDRCNPDMSMQLYNFYEDEIMFLDAVHEALWKK